MTVEKYPTVIFVYMLFLYTKLTLRRSAYKIEKKGNQYIMIRITSIRKCRPADYDDVYLIVRSIASLERSKSGLLKKATHVPDLSPSKSLFFKYLDWKRTGGGGVWKNSTANIDRYLLTKSSTILWHRRGSTRSKSKARLGEKSLFYVFAMMNQPVID